MKNYIKHDEWKIVEEGFHPEHNRITESLLSIGNGRSGQRANFEEKYSGDSLQGTYIAGVYYPDKTRVGWWKNGYPEYFAKILNAANWIGINVMVKGEELDLAKCKILSFYRELDMKSGLLSRSVVVQMKRGKQVEINSKRFLSLARQDVGAICYSLKALNFSGKVSLEPFIDGDVINEDSNYDEKFWIEKEKAARGNEGFVCMQTKKTGFLVCTAMSNRFRMNRQETENQPVTSIREKYIALKSEFKLNEGDEICLEKYVVNISSLYYSKNKLTEISENSLKQVVAKGFDQLFAEHQSMWTNRWETSDIRIEGDVAAQQGIRFNIFHLNQTYLGDDERLNIGPKGFTGEKYGGVTYWDTEAYCLPFYLGTSDEKVARHLLLYRFKHLHKAIENARKLGFNNGAALFPMVTINGEECHNEWEITFEEIHRNGAIAYAIYNYINYTGDQEYLAPYGFQVLLGISRFWSQRVTWSEEQQKFVILGVTGPNEYENNVNNNFHTNYMAVWTLKYTLEAIDYLKKEFPFLYEELVQKLKFNELKETSRWKEIIEKIYFPYDEKRGVYLQQDGFLDKELIPASELSTDERPINQNWSWDRILRSCYIKQADVLQSLYWFEDQFDKETLARHFDFYEPLTVHESSLSSCIHAILASSLGLLDKAYEFYLRTARLDLDDYNNDTEDGLHITSMGGTWMAFVKGFGGLRAKNGQLVLNPFIPESWKSYSFRINFRGAHLEIRMGKKDLTIINHTEISVSLVIWGKPQQLNALQTITIKNSRL
ncbi:MAG: maltose phosphorylase [Bacteroidetes bacterium GWF2_42_66]|nr:MAG: maltose phosphorylase [Bacteroidetes bacterium GWE2_42_39]OFY40916.1 MAG: maltose phosphorylase [Bacteroidetes bacterium GWF2_42_66]HBL76349.1 family 65 glycosyl hydrolase [Prolixibacteraceae bacterium]HCU63611.1 family 65 glycosyl hydrolase [Prolixibacteraceae bacterium]